MQTLDEVVRALCVAVDGVDWDASRVQACVDALHRVGPRATPDEREAAARLLAARIARARVEDADGVAHAAISGGCLVEWGASPRPLGEALLAKITGVLVAARRYADACIADVPERRDDDEETADAICDVDGVAIPYDVFRSHVTRDRPGAAALARLREWALPTIATLTRDRALLARAIDDRALRDAAWSMGDSDAGWMKVLLATQLDSRWRLAWIDHERVFELRVDGVSSNFDLHTGVERALAQLGAGVPDPVRADGSVAASIELLVWSGIAVVKPEGGVRAMPMNEIVWREGLPTDVSAWRGMRTLVATRASIQRGWRAQRPFSALLPEVRVERELPPGEARACIAAMRAEAG